MTIPSAAAGLPAYSEVSFNVQGEQYWHFKDHVRLVIIAIHTLNVIITIRRNWFRWDDSFKLQSITVKGDPHMIIPAEIAKDLHLTQIKLLAAVKSHDDTKMLLSSKILS